ncbi:hypothetical protein, partial [Bradyrhizobium sp. 35]|uniref:hypothetical protein n=1 Tax=Bradyrhizobium sp. 35 TaxID=2782670 RepID=UPI001FFB9BAB
ADANEHFRFGSEAASRQLQLRDQFTSDTGHHGVALHVRAYSCIASTEAMGHMRAPRPRWSVRTPQADVRG